MTEQETKPRVIVLGVLSQVRTVISRLRSFASPQRHYSRFPARRCADVRVLSVRDFERRSVGA